MSTSTNQAYRLANGVLFQVDIEHGYVETIFRDGCAVTGVPSYDDESTARARALGYRGRDDEAVWQMNVDHELLHSVVADLIDGGESHALRWAVDGVRQRGRIPLEERLVFLVQHALNCGTLDELLADQRVSGSAREIG